MDANAGGRVPTPEEQAAGLAHVREQLRGHVRIAIELLEEELRDALTPEDRAEHEAYGGGLSDDEIRVAPGHPRLPEGTLTT